MAKFRYFNTEVWKDEWFVGLRMSEQHLWNYLLTNAATTIGGVYKITVREIAFDTTIETEEVKRIFKDRLEPDGKAFYWPIAGSGWVVVKNWLKHQSLGGKTVVAVAKHFNALPAELRLVLTDPNHELYINYDGVLIPYGWGIVPDENKLPTLQKVGEPKIPYTYPMDDLSHNVKTINNNVRSKNNKPAGGGQAVENLDEADRREELRRQSDALARRKRV